VHVRTHTHTRIACGWLVCCLVDSWLLWWKLLRRSCSKPVLISWSHKYVSASRASTVLLHCRRFGLLSPIILSASASPPAPLLHLRPLPLLRLRLRLLLLLRPLPLLRPLLLARPRLLEARVHVHVLLRGS
jgi:hypothetical protein